MENVVKMKPAHMIVLGFTLVIMVGTFLLYLPVAAASGMEISLINALFTSTSAVCVTGLTVVDTGTTYSLFGQIVIMLLIQIGGLGFMTFGVLFAVLLGKRIGLRQRLLIRETTNAITSQGLVRLSLGIFFIAFLFEAMGSGLLMWRWHGEMGWGKAAYYGIFHSVSAFNNAGFALWPDNLMHYVFDPTINITISLLFILGGIGFTVILDIYNKRKWHDLSLHSKLVIITTLILIIFSFLFILLAESTNAHTLKNLSWSQRILTAYFQAVTTRTAGFNTIDIANMTAASQLVMIFLMFIGASSGSTGGGIKTNTFALLVLTLLTIIRGQEHVNIFKRRMSYSLIMRALAVILISMAVVLLATLMLTFTESSLQGDFMKELFEATSAFGTVGLTMDFTPHLSLWGKIVIILTMFLGRTGPLTLAFALSQKTVNSSIKYAEGKILIG